MVYTPNVAVQMGQMVLCGVSDEVDVNRPAPGRMFPVKTLFLEDALVPWTEIDESPSNHGWFFWADENPMGSMEVSPWDAADLGDGKAFGGAAACFQIAVPPVATEQVPSTVERQTAVSQSWRKV